MSLFKNKLDYSRLVAQNEKKQYYIDLNFLKSKYDKDFLNTIYCQKIIQQFIKEVFEKSSRVKEIQKTFKQFLKQDKKTRSAKKDEFKTSLKDINTDNIAKWNPNISKQQKDFFENVLKAFNYILLNDMTEEQVLKFTTEPTSSYINKFKPIFKKFLKEVEKEIQCEDLFQKYTVGGYIYDPDRKPLQLKTEIKIKKYRKVIDKFRNQYHSKLVEYFKSDYRVEKFNNQFQQLYSEISEHLTTMQKTNKNREDKMSKNRNWFIVKMERLDEHHFKTLTKEDQDKETLNEFFVKIFKYLNYEMLRKQFSDIKGFQKSQVQQIPQNMKLKNETYMQLLPILIQFNKDLEIQQVVQQQQKPVQQQVVQQQSKPVQQQVVQQQQKPVQQQVVQQQSKPVQQQVVQQQQKPVQQQVVQQQQKPVQQQVVQQQSKPVQQQVIQQQSKPVQQIQIVGKIMEKNDEYDPLQNVVSEYKKISNTSYKMEFEDILNSYSKNVYKKYSQKNNLNQHQASLFQNAKKYLN